MGVTNREDILERPGIEESWWGQMCYWRGLRSREGRSWKEGVLRRVPKVGLGPDDDMSGDEQGGVVCSFCSL
jgi:hypothetical protein